MCATCSPGEKTDKDRWNKERDEEREREREREAHVSARPVEKGLR